MILSVKSISPIWPIAGSLAQGSDMEPIRRLIDQRAQSLGISLKDLSLQLELNETYLQQFVKYGKPKKGLPENVRHALAKLLDVHESELGGPGNHLKIAEPKDDTDAFRIDEIDVKGAAGYGGIEPGNRMLSWRAGHDGIVDTPRSTSTFYFPDDYARKELGLYPGRADILLVKGDSMDDGSKYALVDGDRVIIDLASTDLRQGAIFAIWDGEGVIIKQAEIVRNSDPKKLLCTSLNPRYKPFELEITENVHILGRVAAKIARM